MPTHSEWWHSADGPLESCAIVTTEPNEVMRPLHDRMPVILPDEVYDQWLDPKNEEVDVLGSLLKPHPADEMIRPIYCASSNLFNTARSLSFDGSNSPTTFPCLSMRTVVGHAKIPYLKHIFDAVNASPPA